ncbi:hypothetical protein VFMJ11_A0030 [Aliivibrio fischeri MJ11]|uniref:Uncharacterized protein n=1 Tax=Aliivibrio fischeri (strain MJ11) TaxID=388396 RepID=B5ESE1_ALIFM|nr:hypothetical protein VFMJ11_A0030 [Aliivibrio fischeri MJ11]
MKFYFFSHQLAPLFFRFYRKNMISSEYDNLPIHLKIEQKRQ